MRVGTRIPVPFVFPPALDHPHACGDKHRLNDNKRFIRGSSPCVWGQVMCNLYDSFVNGIIPMRVGTS